MRIVDYPEELGHCLWINMLLLRRCPQMEFHSHPLYCAGGRYIETWEHETKTIRYRLVATFGISPVDLPLKVTSGDLWEICYCCALTFKATGLNTARGKQEKCVISFAVRRSRWTFFSAHRCIALCMYRPNWSLKWSPPCLLLRLLKGHSTLPLFQNEPVVQGNEMHLLTSRSLRSPHHHPFSLCMAV